MADDFADGFFEGKHVLLAGAGYVGGALATALRERAATVTILTRNRIKAAAYRDQGMEVVLADLAGREWHAELAAAPDFVVNCVSSGGGGVAGYRHSYLEGMTSLVEWAGQQAVRSHLIYTGSTSVYAQDGGVEVPDGSPAEATDERSKILRATEAALHNYSGPATVVRLAGIYGPGRHYLLDALRRGDETVSGRGGYHLNLIHRDDVVSALLRVMTCADISAGKTYNLTDDGHALKADVVAEIARRLRRVEPSFTGVSAPGRRSHLPDRIIRSDLIRWELGWTPRYPTYREGYAAILNA